MDAVALGIGYTVAYSGLIIGSFILISTGYTWLKHCTRFCWLMLKAERFHGKNFKEAYKKKFLWQLRYIFRVFFTPQAIDIIMLGSHDSYSNAYYFFSKKEMYVKGK